MIDDTNQLTNGLLPTLLSDKNEPILHNYILSTTHDMSEAEKRIMYKIIESIQFLANNKEFKNGVKIETDSFYNRIFSIPIREVFVNGEDNNYSYVIDALKKIRSKNITIETDEFIFITGIIDTIFDYRHSGLLQFSMKEDIFEALLNFSNGWRSIQLDLAMSLSSKYSMLMYELITSKEQPHIHIFNLDDFKTMLALKDKYTRTSDLKTHVLNKAKNELDAKSPISFNYSIKRNVITITSYRRGENNQNKIQNQETS